MCVVIYGGNGWIGQQFQKELRRRQIPFHLAETRVGKVPDEEVRTQTFTSLYHPGRMYRKITSCFVFLSEMSDVKRK